MSVEKIIRATMEAALEKDMEWCGVDDGEDLDPVVAAGEELSRLGDIVNLVENLEGCWVWWRLPGFEDRLRGLYIVPSLDDDELVADYTLGGQLWEDVLKKAGVWLD
jgi:hypothetical protein